MAITVNFTDFGVKLDLVVAENNPQHIVRFVTDHASCLFKTLA